MKIYHFKKDDGELALVHCPKCDYENYYMYVLEGKCCWCGFNINVDPLKSKPNNCIGR